MFDIVFELGPTTRRVGLSTLVKVTIKRGHRVQMCSFGGKKKKKKNPEDERKILYRNIKKKMATSGQL